MLWASKKVGRPVKYVATRHEAFISDYQGRDLATSVELALSKEGKFLAMRCDNISNAGARCVSLSPLGKGSGLVTGSYDIPAATLHARAVFTNTTPTQAYRSSGRPEVNFAIERLIDMAAHEMGIDRVALRRAQSRQAKAFPYTNAVGAHLRQRRIRERSSICRWKSPTGRASRSASARARSAASCAASASPIMSSPPSARPKEQAQIIVQARKAA